MSRLPHILFAKIYSNTSCVRMEMLSKVNLMPVEFKIPTKPTIKLIDPDGYIAQDLRKAGMPPPA
jgi:hypothetical protein